MQKDSNVKLSSLKVDGGACANNYLMQFQADLLNTTVERPEIIETTVMGCAYLAGICVGLWKQTDITKHKAIDQSFIPTFTVDKRQQLYNTWRKAVERTKDWLD